jgi:hypothetical protein
MIWTLEIGETREVHVERYNHRHRLWKVEAEFAPDMDTHDVSISRFGGAPYDEQSFRHRAFRYFSSRSMPAPINHRPGIFVHSMSNFIRAAPSQRHCAAKRRAGPSAVAQDLGCTDAIGLLRLVYNEAFKIC